MAPVVDRIPLDDPRLTAHRLPMALANDAVQDLIQSAHMLHEAVVEGAPQAQQDRIRAAGLEHYRSYVEFMVQAAHHVRALKP